MIPDGGLGPAYPCQRCGTSIAMFLGAVSPPCEEPLGPLHTVDRCAAAEWQRLRDTARACAEALAHYVEHDVQTCYCAPVLGRAALAQARAAWVLL